MDKNEEYYDLEKIAIEPDLGDLRKSTDKALPAPPKTPKRVLRKYRFSAVFPIAFAIASSVLTVVVVLAGRQVGTFGEHYLVAWNATDLNRGNFNSQQASVMTDGASAMANKARLADVYFMYLRTICSRSGSGNANNTVIERCESWGDTTKYLATLTQGLRSIESPGQSSISVSLVAKIITSLKTFSTELRNTRKASFTFLIVSLVGSMLSAVSAFPAIGFPHSRLLIHFNFVWPIFACIASFLAAVLVTIVVSNAASVVGGLSEVVGVDVKMGDSAVLFVWLAWFFSLLSCFYWGAIWFVEVRTWGFSRRARSQDEIGNWRDIGKEIWRDIKVEKTI